MQTACGFFLSKKENERSKDRQIKAQPADTRRPMSLSGRTRKVNTLSQKQFARHMGHATSPRARIAPKGLRYAERTCCCVTDGAAST